MQPTLLILAAGMGSRYGGLKQLDAMGPNGETVLDYSVYDAIRAGFGKVVFVIRRQFEDAFRTRLGATFESRVDVDYVFQELGDLPDGHVAPEGREKPWGTAHAVRAARNSIATPFAVINADDFYGRDAYSRIARYFTQGFDGEGLQTCMVGYSLQNTLSKHGAVNRGICSVEAGILLGVAEHFEIQRDVHGRIYGRSATEELIELAPNTLTSMNFWGFTPALFQQLEDYFVKFLEKQGRELKSECYLPGLVNHLIQAGQVDCRVIETSSNWFGMTYPEDKPLVQATIAELVAKGTYPRTLDFSYR